MQAITKIRLNGTVYKIGGTSADLFPVEAKETMLSLMENVAYTTDDGQALLDNLADTLTIPSNLASITAVYTPGEHVVMETDNLDSLRPYLSVSAHYEDGSVVTVVNYALIGNLHAPASTVTVSYRGVKTTISVDVSTLLPEGYVSVPWVASLNTGTTGPLVGTGVTPSSSGTIVVKLGFMLTDDLAGTRYIISSNVGSTAPGSETCGFCVCAASNNTILEGFNGLHAQIAPNAQESFSGRRIDCEATFSPTSASVTDGVFAKTISGTGRVHEGKIYFYGLKNRSQNKLAYPANARIYYANVTDDGVEILNALPCMQVATQLVGFYDTVNERFFTATGLTAPEVD